MSFQRFFEFGLSFFSDLISIVSYADSQIVGSGVTFLRASLRSSFALFSAASWARLARCTFRLWNPVKYSLRDSGLNDISSMRAGAAIFLFLVGGRMIKYIVLVRP